MSARFEPGAVMVAAHPLKQGLVRGIIDTDGAFYTTDQSVIGVSSSSFAASNLRPLVVIDPEDREQVDRLDVLLHEGNLDVAAALREFANPTPVEPSDPRARVTDRRENIWRLLADGEWVCTSGPDIGEYVTWSQLAGRGPLEVEVETP